MKAVRMTMARTLTLVALLGVGTALAHHPFQQEFDASKPVSLTGTVAAVVWAAPHVTIRADVPDKNGKPERWNFEAGSPAELEQHGVTKKALQPGEKVTIDGYLALKGKHSAAARQLRLPDGRELNVGSHDGGPEK